MKPELRQFIEQCRFCLASVQRVADPAYIYDGSRIGILLNLLLLLIVTFISIRSRIFLIVIRIFSREFRTS